MKNTVILLTAIFCMLLTGCTQESRSHHPWIGKDASELIDHYGQPQQVFSDGSGGKILSWSLIPIEEGEIDNNKFDRSPLNTGSQNVFRVNANETIYQQGF